jgi:hypothetical protein
MPFLRGQCDNHVLPFNLCPFNARHCVHDAPHPCAPPLFTSPFSPIGENQIPFQTDVREGKLFVWPNKVKDKKPALEREMIVWHDFKGKCEEVNHSTEKLQINIHGNHLLLNETPLGQSILTVCICW